ncbi:protein-lysine N-methyltransferase SMYD4 [Augochlora pura]
MEKLMYLLMRKLTFDELEQISSEYGTLCTDEDRIKFTLNVMLEYNIIPRVHRNLKNADIAEKFRAQGNKLYTTGRLTRAACIEALELYTKSVANAPCSSKQLALAYANRSAVLLKVHKYEECIRDVDRALVLPYPDHLKAKLYMRKAESLKAMQKKKISLEHTNNTELNNKSCPFEIESYNKEIPCASDAISLIYNEDYGRHIVANRKINAGEVIVIEQFYSMILLQSELYTHCSNCLEVCWANIPCNGCTNVMYCSEECRIEQWKKCHDMECVVFSSMLNMNSGSIDLLSLRIAIQAVRESSIDNIRKELEEIDRHNDPRTKGFSKNGTFESLQYRSLLSLATNSEKRSVDDLFSMSLDHSVTLYILATCTNMFGKPLKNDLSLLIENPDITFFGGLLMRHQQMILSNSFTIVELRSADVDLGIGALLFSSFFNHSCNTNTTRVGKGRNMTMITMFPIKPGEQIFCDYGYHYAISTTSERQKKLSEQYYFNCNCPPCQEDWPTYHDLKPAIPLIQDDNVRHKLMKLLLKFDTYYKIVETGNIDDKPFILTDLLEMVEGTHEILPMASKEIVNVIEVLKQVYVLKGNVLRLPRL